MITYGEIMSRRYAVQLLYWLHHYRRWNEFHDERGSFAAFPQPYPQSPQRRRTPPIVMILAAAALALIASMVLAYARDDGRYAASPLKPWFDGLKSGKGQCCSDADGNVVLDADWESRGDGFRVRVDGEWMDVPADAVITEPNRFGRTMVWPTWADGQRAIRCFMPGPMG